MKERESSAGKGKKRTKKTLPMTDEEWYASCDLSSATIGTMAFVWVVRPSLRVKRKVPILATVWRVRPWTRDARAIGEGRWRCHGPPSPSRTTCRASSSWWKSSIDRNVATPRSRPRSTDGNGMRRTIPSFRRVSSMDVSSSSLLIDRRPIPTSLLSPSLRLPPAWWRNELAIAPPSTTSRRKTHTPSRADAHPPLLSSTLEAGVHLLDVGYGYGYVALGREGGGFGGRRRRRSSRRRITIAIRKETTCDSETCGTKRLTKSIGGTRIAWRRNERKRGKREPWNGRREKQA